MRRTKFSISVFYLIEFRCFAVALFFKLDDVPPELTFHRLDNCPGSSLKATAENSGTIWSFEVSRSPPSAAPGSFDFFFASSAKSTPFLISASRFLASSSAVDQNVAGADLDLVANLLDGFVIDLAQRGLGHGGLALVAQHAVHQQPVAGEGEAALEIVAVGDLLILGGLGDELHVDDVADQVVAFGGLVHGGQITAQLDLGGGEVALPDVDAVDLGKHGIGVLGLHRDGGKRERAPAGEGKDSGASAAVQRSRESVAGSWKDP